MGTKKLKLSAKHALPFATANKLKRQDLYIKQRKVRGAEKHKERHQRRKEEDKDPRLREQRLKRNVPSSIDRKRTWDQMHADSDDVLGMSVDAEKLKRQALQEKAELERDAAAESEEDNVAEDNDDVDSMLDSESEDEEAKKAAKKEAKRAAREASPVQSTTSTNFDSTPEGLAARFP